MHALGECHGAEKPQKIIRKDIFYVSGANSLLRQFSVKKSLIFMENSCSQACFQGLYHWQGHEDWKVGSWMIGCEI